MPIFLVADPSCWLHQPEREDNIGAQQARLQLVTATGSNVDWGGHTPVLKSKG